MKKKKLKLEKETIRDLQNPAMNEIEGGTAPTSPIFTGVSAGASAGSVVLSSVALSTSPVVSTLVASTGVISAVSMSVYKSMNSLLSNNGNCPVPPGPNTQQATNAWSNCPGCIVKVTEFCGGTASCPI